MALINQFATAAIRSEQVAKRMRDLLPEKLRLLSKRVDDQAIPARRRALITAEFHSYLEEYLAVSLNAHVARVQYTTHKMLYSARLSLGSLQRMPRKQE